MPKNAETLLTDFLQCALKRLAEIFNGFDTQYLEPSRLIMRDSQAIVEVHTRCQHRASGVWLDTRKQHVWLLEDGFETFMNCTRR